MSQSFAFTLGYVTAMKAAAEVEVPSWLRPIVRTRQVLGNAMGAGGGVATWGGKTVPLSGVNNDPGLASNNIAPASPAGWAAAMRNMLVNNKPPAPVAFPKSN